MEGIETSCAAYTTYLHNVSVGAPTWRGLKRAGIAATGAGALRCQ